MSFQLTMQHQPLVISTTIQPLVLSIPLTMQLQPLVTSFPVTMQLQPLVYPFDRRCYFNHSSCPFNRTMQLQQLILSVGSTMATSTTRHVRWTHDATPTACHVHSTDYATAFHYSAHHSLSSDPEPLVSTSAHPLCANDGAPNPISTTAHQLCLTDDETLGSTIPHDLKALLTSIIPFQPRLIVNHPHLVVPNSHQRIVLRHRHLFIHLPGTSCSRHRILSSAIPAQHLDTICPRRSGFRPPTLQHRLNTQPSNPLDSRAHFGPHSFIQEQIPL